MVRKKSKTDELTQANNHHFYRDSVTPVPNYREMKHMEFLDNVPPEGTGTEHLNSFEYPSYFVATDLLDGGYLSREEVPPDGGRGNNAYLYTITDEGKALIQLMHTFYDRGEIIPNVHATRPLIRYWKMNNPERLIQYYTNILMGYGDESAVREAVAELVTISQEMLTSGKRAGEPTQTAVYAMALLDAYNSLGVVDFKPTLSDKLKMENPVEEHNLIPVPHSPSETKAGRMSHRYNGMDKVARDYIMERLDTGSERDLMNYILVVGMFTARAGMKGEK